MVDASALLRQGLLQLSKSGQVRAPGREGAGQPRRRPPLRRRASAPPTPSRAAAELAAPAGSSRIDFLGEDTTDLAQARAHPRRLRELLAALSEAGPHPGRPGRGQRQAQRGRPVPARRRRTRSPSTTPARSARRRRNAGTTVTLDMEDHTTTDATLETLRELRQDFPSVGAVLQAYLHRTEADCRDLAARGQPGAPVQGRLQGAGVGGLPGRRRGRQVLRALPEGPHGRRGLPDGGQPRPAAGRDRRRAGRPARPRRRQLRVPDALRHPARGAEAASPTAATRCGSTSPTAQEWYGYLMRRMAERPANTVFFLRALATKG